MHKSRYAPAAEPSPEDAIRAAMLADLGVTRRDVMFAADGGHEITDREKRAAKLRARGEADDRQAAIERGVAAGDNMAVALNAWNTASNFEADPFALHSEDIAGGQAHRERLRADRESGRLRDFDEPRRGRHYGEERAAYVQSRNASGAYVAVGGAPAGPRGTNRDFASTTPRSGPGLQSAPIPTNSAGGRAAAPRPTGHIRAPSPRAAGTVRFGTNGRRIEVPASRVPGNAPTAGPSRPTAPAPRATASSSNTPPRPIPAPTTKPSAPRPTASSSNAPARPTAPSAAPNGRTSAPRPQPQPKPHQPFQNTLHTPEDHVVRQILQMRSYQCAAVPEEREKFLASHTEAAKYLREGRRRLVNETTAIIKRGSEKEMEDYVKGHPERGWMLEAAKQAKTMALETPDADAAAYYANNTEREDFWQTAKEAYASKRAELASTLSSASSAPRSAGTNVASATSAATQATGINNPAPPTTQGSSPLDQPATTSHQSRGTTNGTVPEAYKHMSSASSDTSMRSADTTVTTPPKKCGTLNVTLVDVNGNFDNEQVKVDAPVTASFSLNSMVVGYDMRGCLDSLKVWAEGPLGGGHAGQDEMVDVSHGLQGAVQRDDGIWESDEEL